MKNKKGDKENKEKNKKIRRWLTRIARIAGIVAVFAIVLGLAWGALTLYRAWRKGKILEARGEVTVVVFGDSIWDICRDETGIAARLEAELPNTTVINCAIMGTTAAYKTQGGDQTEEEIAEWNTKSLVGLLTLETGEEIIARETGVTEIPWEEADYFILAYGLNDYFSAVPRESEDALDITSYSGALRMAVSILREKNPQAQILILSQTYCQGYAYGKVDSESDWRDYGGGTGPDYVAAAQAVAGELDCTFVNNYEDMGINIHNGAKYLSDATHLTALGRHKYAKNLAKYLLILYADYGTE